ncbi:MAG: PD40 domain-containing protein [Deltaproteobacteria bacterium]|nr:PD40 domain-containing protein [Deltaproteobacteria bacterium]
MVTVIREVAVTDNGVTTVTVEKAEEVAERSTVDKDAESLMAPQRYADIGSYFQNYAVNKKDEVVLSIFNQEGHDGSDLWVYKTGKMRLTKTNYFHWDPAFSADGQSVYFVSDKGRVPRSASDQACYLWKVRSTGFGGLTRIGTPAYRYYSPAESPDGEHILVTCQEFMGNSHFLWYMKSNGALPTQLKQGQAGQWLDNQTIIFQAPDENTGLQTIWTCKIDGSVLTQILSDSEMLCIQPAPSPDGKYVAYVKQKPGKPESRDVYIMNLKDGLSQQLTTNKSRDDLPHWSADGKYLYFRSSRGLAWNLWRLDTSFLNR